MLERRFLEPETYAIHTGKIGYWIADSGKEGPVLAVLAAVADEYGDTPLASSIRLRFNKLLE